MKNSIKISIAQIDVVSGGLYENTNKVIEMCKKAAEKGYDLIVFPEMIDTGYDMTTITKKAQTWKLGTIPRLIKCAQEENINIIAGVSEKENDKIYNAVILIDRQGNIAGKYRKTHLITADPINEDQFLSPGNELGIFIIDGLKVGVMTCYEIRFPAIARSLTMSGAKVLIIPAAWPLVRWNHWTSLIRARAIENQVFVCAANRIGIDSSLQFAGNSMHISPYGNVLSEGSQIHEQEVNANYDLELINTVRNQIKVFQDRRTDLYKIS